MQLTQIILLACSSLTLATPAHRQQKGEWHRSYKSGCASASAGHGTGLPSSNSSAALPYSMEPTATAGGPPAGGSPTTAPVESPSGEGAASSPASSVPIVKTSTKAAAPVQISSTPALIGGGKTYTASFTGYGAGDTFGSPNCNTATAACGWYTYPGYNAAASENLFGVGPGAGAGPACGLCFQLTAKTNPYNNNSPLNGTKSIVVKVNNLCPKQGNPLCSQNTLSDKNSLGGQVNFDLCKDDGAAGALFGSSGVGAALGTATQVSCDQWTGSQNKYS